MKENIEIEKSYFYAKTDDTPYFYPNENFNIIFLKCAKKIREINSDIEIWHYSFFEDEYRLITTLKKKKNEKIFFNH